ncbi:hypothetical protein MMB232_03003 [Brevundimonas subvibrioides]
MVLSHPTMQTTPSSWCPCTASSMESATTSRLINEAFIPAVPIEMPSVTTMVLKSIGKPPAATIPARTSLASRSRCMLHGVTDDQVLTTAIIGLSKSASSMPAARR